MYIIPSVSERNILKQSEKKKEIWYILYKKGGKKETKRVNFCVR